MPREADLSSNERTFILEALRAGVRLDGRPLDAFRDLELTFGDEHGVANVRLGKTRYLDLTYQTAVLADNHQCLCLHLSRSHHTICRPQV
jgi:hypothetical protein